MPSGAQLNAALRGRTGELPSIPSPEARVPFVEVKVDRSKTQIVARQAWVSNDQVSIG
jgi:hypothetical protein